MNASRQLDIAQWLVALAVRCTPRTTENIEVLARDYASGLDDLPTEVFSPQSKEAAARNFEHFPAYKPLRVWLTKWWDAHKPVQVALPLPPDAHALSVEDRAHVRSWINLKPEWKAAGRLENALSTFRNRTAVFAYICRTDTDAASIAVRRHWSVDAPMTHERSEDEIAHAAQTASTAISAIRGRGPTDIGSAIERAEAQRFREAQQARHDENIKRQRDASPAVQRARAAQPANTNEPYGDVIPPTKPDPRPAGVTAEEWSAHTTPKPPTIDGEVISPVHAATVTGAAWRPPWED